MKNTARHQTRYLIIYLISKFVRLHLSGVQNVINLPECCGLMKQSFITDFKLKKKKNTNELKEYSSAIDYFKLLLVRLSIMLRNPLAYLANWWYVTPPFPLNSPVNIVETVEIDTFRFFHLTE